MERRVNALQVIRDELKVGLKLEGDVGEETVLADIGVTSMYLITLAITLNRKYGMSLDGFVKQSTPNTVGELLRALEGTNCE
jgi:hypothetical protein